MPLRVWILTTFTSKKNPFQWHIALENAKPLKEKKLCSSSNEICTSLPWTFFLSSRTYPWSSIRYDELFIIVSLQAWSGVFQRGCYQNIPSYVFRRITFYVKTLQSLCQEVSNLANSSQKRGSLCFYELYWAIFTNQNIKFRRTQVASKGSLKVFFKVLSIRWNAISKPTDLCIIKPCLTSVSDF